MTTYLILEVTDGISDVTAAHMARNIDAEARENGDSATLSSDHCGMGVRVAGIVDRNYDALLPYITSQAPAPPAKDEFPGISMGLLAYDIAEAIEHGEYPGLDDVGDSDIEVNLPAFLRACRATADESQS